MKIKSQKNGKDLLENMKIYLRGIHSQCNGDKYKLDNNALISKLWKYFSSLMGNLCAQLFDIIFENGGHCLEQSAFYGKMQEHFALSLCLT